MLKSLQKVLSKTEPEVKLSAEDIQAAVAQALEGVKAEFEEFKQTAEALLAASEEKVAGLQAELADLAGKLAEAQSALEAANAEKAKAEADGLAVKLAARKEKLVAALGTERADALLKVTEGMEDVAFEAVVAALGVSAAAEANSSMFTEAGVDAQADTAAVMETPEMKALRAKYQNQGK